MLIRILNNLKGRADSKNQAAKFTWSAMSQMMQNITGQEVDYDAFKAEFDANPQLKNLVDNFDENGITIKTKTKAELPGVPGDKAKAQANVMSTAKKAANKLLGK
jgi:hypothetical protein